MDPLSAIGLVSSVITFIDFGYEVISAAKEVHASATGTTKANEHTGFLNTRMKTVANDLANARTSPGAMSADKRRLIELADKCLGLSNDLETLLDKLKAKDPKSKRQVLSSIVQNMRKQDKKRELEARLDQCREQLHLQLSHTTRLESLSRLDEITQTGRCQERELASLNQQLAILKHALAGMNPRSKLQDEARSVLDLSDLAISKVVQNKLLEALRFEKMESRFDNIEDAHAETFKWILSDETSSSGMMQTLDTKDPWSSNLLRHLKEEEPLRREIQKHFTNWLSTGNGIFHISGKPGAGKSTLMKYFAESDDLKEYLNTWAGGKELVFASFFFWRHGNDFQKSLSGLLRSLLYSVLDQNPELARTVFPAHWEAASHSSGKTLHFRQSDIQKAFINLTRTSDVYHKHKFAFFIDGLDEFEGHDDTLVKTLLEWAQSGLENIKICVSSRELPIFQQRFSKCPRFRLHEATYHDIFLFVYDTLQNNEDVKLMSQPQEVVSLGRRIVSRAEGVFLWTSLTLRLVERGLVLEDSIEDLKNTIDALPTEFEQLFRVIFDSIKTEPDLAKRRKAMRFLALAVDEIKVINCGGELYLSHLSFMDDYDRNPEFLTHLLGQTIEAETSMRLSRCRKQISGGCGGFLSIRSATDADPPDFPVRKETVALAHRSLIEFFELPDVQSYIEGHSQGFDRLHFYCQSLLAELRVWSSSLVKPGFEDDELSTSLIFPETQAFELFLQKAESMPELENNWLGRDVERLISLSNYFRVPDITTLLLTLNHLRQLAKVAIKSMWFVHSFYTVEWDGEMHAGFSGAYVFKCDSEAYILFIVLKYGLYELYPAESLDAVLGDETVRRIAYTLTVRWINQNPRIVPISLTVASCGRMLRTMATCLAHGTSANLPVPDTGRHIPITVWQNLVWSSILTNHPRVSPGPLWLCYLLFGAERNFILNFEQSCNFSEIDRSGKLILVTGRWGMDSREVYSPIWIHSDQGGILDLAKLHNWSLSLRDIACFMFPLHAERFRRIYDLCENSPDLSKENLGDLRREFGFDLDSWQAQVWDAPQVLFQSWEGESKILRLDTS